MKHCFIMICTLLSGYGVSAQMNNMMIRISEIEIDSTYLEAYKAILKEESQASVKLEPGVIAIYPMYQKENPTQVRILEIYASREAYESHLKTPHFQIYKTTTYQDPPWDMNTLAKFEANAGKKLSILNIGNNWWKCESNNTSCGYKSFNYQKINW